MHTTVLVSSSPISPWIKSPKTGNVSKSEVKGDLTVPPVTDMIDATNNELNHTAHFNAEMLSIPVNLIFFKIGSKITSISFDIARRSVGIRKFRIASANRWKRLIGGSGIF
jgi:hypothetical protein